MDVEKRTYLRSKSAVQRGEVQDDSRPSKNSPRKRSYQREHNARRNSWQPRDQSSPPNDDLRSPCHKQPRFKGQQENSPANRSSNNKGPWSTKNTDSSNDKSYKMELTNSEFPPLGFKMDGFTPEPSKDWGSIMDEEEQASKQCKEQSQKSLKPKRRLLLSVSDSSETNKNQTKEDAADTTSKVLRPIITDPHKLTQRQKQLDIGKNTKSYGHYIKTIQRNKRCKEDPWTPDKFQQCSTRSWVGQIKVWRRRLHQYDLSSDTKEDLFSTSSASSSQATEDTSMDVEDIHLTKSSSIEDMFHGFDLDSCLNMDDGLPL